MSVDEATAELPVTVTELGTRVLVREASTWMSMGTPTQILPRTDNHIPISNPRCMLLDPNSVNRMLPSLITGTTRGPITTPRGCQDTTPLLEIASAIVNIVNPANVAGIVIVIVIGSVGVATSIPDLIPQMHLPPTHIHTLLSRPALKTSL